MSRVVRVVAVCLALLSLLAVAGCGGDAKKSNEYVKAINQVQSNFAANVQKVGAAQQSPDALGAAKKTFTDLRGAIDQAITELKRVSPPDKVKGLHGQLVQEMTDFKSEVEQAGQSLDSKDPKKVLAAQSKFAQAAGSVGTRIANTIDAINKKLHS